MPEEPLDGSDPAARIEQLRGAGVPEPVRIGLHPYAFPGGLDAAANEASAQRRVAIQEDMLSRSGPAHGQVLPERLDGGISDINAAVFLALAIPDAEITSIQVQIFQAQFLHFAGAQPALPEQIEHGAVQEGRARHWNTS